MGEIVYTTEDGTDVRVGDKVNHPGGWSYEIVGRESESVVEKIDYYDDNWGVVTTTLESDIKEHGFDERVDE